MDRANLDNAFKALLERSLVGDLCSVNFQNRQILEDFSCSGSGSTDTFGDLLFHPHPPVELLESTKAFAHKQRCRRDATIPNEVATMLYFASIAAALSRCKECITSLSSERMRAGMEWAIEQPWIEDRTAALIREGMEHIEETDPS